MREAISNQDLLSRIADQDAAALEEFYDRHHRLVYALALRILGDPSQAEEVVLEIFWQVWQQAGRFSHEQSRATTWLVSISRERALDHLRRTPERNAPYRSVHPGAHSRPTEGPESSESDARAALDSLTAVQRQAIEMAYYRGLNPVEIAAALREPEDLVKSRIRMGLGQIRAALLRAAPSIRESS